MYTQEEVNRLKELSRPLVEYLQEKHPYYSIAINADEIVLNEVQIGIPIKDIIQDNQNN